MWLSVFRLSTGSPHPKLSAHSKAVCPSVLCANGGFLDCVWLKLQHWAPSRWYMLRCRPFACLATELLHMLVCKALKLPLQILSLPHQKYQLCTLAVHSLLCTLAPERWMHAAGRPFQRVTLVELKRKLAPDRAILLGPLAQAHSVVCYKALV